METTAGNNVHGYDQQYRWGQRGDYDCSSAVITAWQSAGVPVKLFGATYTGNIQSVFERCGFANVTKSVNLNTGAGLQRGDVLLNRAHHTAMYCGNGKEVEASINEKGKATGGLPGDQTGKGFLVRPYRNYPWDVVLRYIEKTPEQIAKEVIAGKWGSGNDRKTRIEAAGYNYAQVQEMVNNIMKYGGTKSIQVIAKEIIAGKWGNGADRRRRLAAAGYTSTAIMLIQEEVNRLLSDA